MEPILAMFNILYILLLILITEGLLKYVDAYFSSSPKWVSHRHQNKMIVTTLIGLILHFVLSWADNVALVIPDGIYHFQSAQLFTISSLFSFFFTLYFYDLLLKGLLNRVKSKLTKSNDNE